MEFIEVKRNETERSGVLPPEVPEAHGYQETSVYFWGGEYDLVDKQPYEMSGDDKEALDYIGGIVRFECEKREAKIRRSMRKKAEKQDLRNLIETCTITLGSLVFGGIMMLILR